MAKQVQAQVAGGDIKTFKNVETVRDLRVKLDLGKDHSATVNGEPAKDDSELEDFQFVAFAPKVAGGNR